MNIPVTVQGFCQCWPGSTFGADRGSNRAPNNTGRILGRSENRRHVKKIDGAPEEIRTPDPQIRSLPVRQHSRRSKIVNGRASRDLTWVAVLAIDPRSQLSHRTPPPPSPILRCDFPPAASTALPRAKFPANRGTAKSPRKRCVLKGLKLGCGDPQQTPPQTFADSNFVEFVGV